MKVAYTAGPYRARTIRGTVENIRAAEAVALELWRIGYAVICPHMNTACFDGAAPDSVWLDGDLEILKRCDLVVVVPGWESSSGTQAEIREALNVPLPVYYWPDDREQIVRAVADPFAEFSIEPAAPLVFDPVEYALDCGPD